jgi:hypothetical protein
MGGAARPGAPPPRTPAGPGRTRRVKHTGALEWAVLVARFGRGLAGGPQSCSGPTTRTPTRAHEARVVFTRTFRQPHPYDMTAAVPRPYLLRRAVGGALVEQLLERHLGSPPASQPHRAEAAAAQLAHLQRQQGGVQCTGEVWRVAMACGASARREARRTSGVF